MKISLGFSALLLSVNLLLLAAPHVSGAGPAYGLNSLPKNRPISIGYLNSVRSASEMNSLVWSGFDAVVHAFAEPVDSNGSVGEGLPNFLPNQAPLLSAAHAHGKAVILSIGGADPASLATQFNNIASNSTKRANFCQAVVTYLQTRGYDGVDIDWEFPSVPTGKANMTLLMQDLYAAVKAANPNYIVMFATGPGYWMGSYDFAALASVTDFFFYFGYDWTRGTLVSRFTKTVRSKIPAAFNTPARAVTTNCPKPPSVVEFNMYSTRDSQPPRSSAGFHSMGDTYSLTLLP